MLACTSSHDQWQSYEEKAGGAKLHGNTIFLIVDCKHHDFNVLIYAREKKFLEKQKDFLRKFRGTRLGIIQRYLTLQLAEIQADSGTKQILR